MQSRLTRRLSEKLSKAHRSMSFRAVARKFEITTPAGKPNSGMVKRLIEGYQPKKFDTLWRCHLLPQPKMPTIHDEPIRRVLIGAWRMNGRWVGPEEYFGGSL
jgi:hypothetical protein